MTVTVVDRAGYGITHREFTDEGYLRVPGRVARAGVQHYKAKELGLEDRKPDALVGVYRPPEEVFSYESLQSYADADVTDDHPKSLVDPKTFKDVAVGHTSSPGRQEGDYVIVDLLVKDADAIQAVQDGKVALSAGYEAQYDSAPGEAQDGELYEFVQRNIKINHVALVDRARAGPDARLFDNDNGGPAMGTKVTLDGGKTVEVADDATAQLIQSTLDAKQKSYEDMEAKAKEYEDEAAKLRDQMEKEKAEKDQAIEDRDKAKQAASDEAIAERVKAVTDAQGKAEKIAGGDFTCDSMDVPTIQREALKKARPTIDWDDKPDAYVAAAWDMEVERINENPAGGTHDRLGEDLKHLYSQDGQPNAGREAYSQFLAGQTGGKH